MLKIQSEKEITHTAVIDSVAATQILNQKVTEVRSLGYYAASIDTVNWGEDTFAATLYIGEQYAHIQIRNHDLPRDFLPADRVSTLTLRQFDRLQNTLLETYENAGYPFVSFQMLNTVEKSDTLSCDIQFFTHLKVIYDTLTYYGKSKMSKRYMAKYLGIEEGKIYNESDVETIDKKLRNLPLVRLNSATQVVFTRGKANVILNIDDRVTDRVDGVVGLAPNSANAENNDLVLTGEVNVELKNLFKSGKELSLQWKNFLQRSQKLDVGVTYPYIFNTKLGVNGELNLNKFDTLFLSLKSKLSFRYQQKGNNYIQFYYQNISSSLITVDTNRVRSLQKLPDNNPYKIDNYGLAVFQQDFDYLPNPRSGFSVWTDVAVGQKTILRNSDIARVRFFNPQTNEYTSLYDTLNISSVRLDIKFKSSFFIPIKKRSTLRQLVEFNGLFADQVFFNELYNFGGYATLRGFDENELFASKALVYTAEYRYLIGENSNVGVFINTGIIENKLQSSDLVYDTPYGFGALANIQVGKGVLNLAYALGSQKGNPIQINSAKFHFGIVNYF